MQVTVLVPSGPMRLGIVGAGERNLKILREALGVNVAARQGTVRVSGERSSVGVARSVLERMIRDAPQQHGMTRQQVLDLIGEESSRAAPIDATREIAPSTASSWDGTLDVYSSGRAIKPKTPNQEAYISAIRDNDLVFGIGPAGTGKTYLAVAAAIHLLKADRIHKIVLVRPAVEAGERLGFLPGGLEEKVNPYLRPLLDALHDMVDNVTMRKFLDNDVLEIAPLAFMRGRTLNHAFVILDEAQNTTQGQMKMFLTRMGHGTKMVVTGDTTQIDLPDPAQSGLIDASNRLKQTEGVAFVRFDGADIVRHELVQRVVDSYDDVDGGPRQEPHQGADSNGDGYANRTI